MPTDRVRKPGAGRKRRADSQPELLAALDSLVDPAARGDPESPLRWTRKSTRRLAAELRGQGFRVCHRVVADLLREAGYSSQGNRKTVEGRQHPDRDAPFAFIAAAVAGAHRRRQPVVSVDAKEKELVGGYRNAGRDGCPVGRPTPGSSASAWTTTRRRSRRSAAGGGGNASRSRLWKVESQKLADALRLTVRVCHFPPGTSKWNTIEHRLFSPVSRDWRGRPVTGLELIVRLIGATTTATGLVVKADLDRGKYPTGRTVSDTELAAVRRVPDAFRGEWNYRIEPRAKL